MKFHHFEDMNSTTYSKLVEESAVVHDANQTKYNKVELGAQKLKFSICPEYYLVV